MSNVTFLGVEGSGKTVLAMSIVNMFRAHEAEGWFLRPETRGAFRFSERKPNRLTDDALPHQTTELRQVQFSVVKDGETQCSFDVLDYPGEVYRLAFLDAKDDENPEVFRQRVQAHQDDINELLQHLMHTEQVFVLFNLCDGENLAHNSANLDAVWVTNACLDFLYRLPHRPNVTLLLTQIDRYVDLEQYELDSKIYVEHHLPLIHHNFPDLDVCAVSALGAAHETFGIDAILLRFLIETPFVQSAIASVREARAEYENYIKQLKHEIQLLSNLRNLLQRISKLSAAAPEWKSRLPWFIAPEDLAMSDGLMHPEAASECIKLLYDCSSNLKKNSSASLITRIQLLLTFLQQYAVRHGDTAYLSRSFQNEAYERIKRYK